MSTTTATFATSRINDLLARQRSSRLRDLTFTLLLAIGIGSSLGALRAAAAQAGAPVVTVPAPTSAQEDAMASVPACEHDLSC